MDTFSGPLGIVLVPSAGIRDAALGLAAELSPKSAVPTKNPNIILYYGHLNNVPTKMVEQLLTSMRVLVGTELTMGQISDRGGKILTWQAYGDNLFNLAHLAALYGLSRFRRREGLSKAEHELLQLNNADMGAIERDGNPFTRDNWRPEIRLTWHRNAPIAFADSFKDLRNSLTSTGFVESVQFVRFEELGTVKLGPLMTVDRRA